MQGLALRGLLILGVAYAMATLFFNLSGLPGVAAAYLGGTYTLTAAAAFLFARGVLEIMVGTDRDIVFFIALRRLTDPLQALVMPITPGFLLPFAVSLYAAFLFFFLKLFLFGDGFMGVPPLFIVAYILIASSF